MRRFLIFAGMTYYPAGGWGDFRGSEDTKEAALSLMRSYHYDWVQIVDSQTGDIVEQWGREY